MPSATWMCSSDFLAAGLEGMLAMPNRRTFHDGKDTSDAKPKNLAGWQGYKGTNSASSFGMLGALIFSQRSVRRNASTRNASVVFNLVYAIMTKM